MPRAFKLPDLGEGIHEGEIVAVHATVGDHIKEGDVILEVETDKATVEIPSPFTGRVIEILVKVGDLIQVGAEMIRFDDETANQTAPSAPPPQRETSVAAPSPPASPQSSKNSATGPVPASPSTRRLARELGVDLAQVPPSGPAGLVTAEDVRAFATKNRETERTQKTKAAHKPIEMETVYEAKPLMVDAPPLPDFEKYGPVKRIPLRSIRRATAKQMTVAWSQIPHATSQDTVDVTDLENFRQEHKAAVARQGGHLSFTVLALKALVVALKAHPRANASLDAAKGEIVLKQYYHIGVAVNTDDGLMVPVIRDVDRKSILELSVELDQLAKRTRERKAAIEEMRGGTFTLTNMGAIGGGAFTPIINYPDVAIMGFGQARWQPVVKENSAGEREITSRLMAPVVMAIDHRVMDGVDAVRFIEEIKRCLENPGWLFITMS